MLPPTVCAVRIQEQISHCPGYRKLRPHLKAWVGPRLFTGTSAGIRPLCQDTENLWRSWQWKPQCFLWPRLGSHTPQCPIGSQVSLFHTRGDNTRIQEAGLYRDDYGHSLNLAITLVLQMYIWLKHSNFYVAELQE